jgi:hypothetical protein
VRDRVARAERRLRVGSGPLVTCPHCDGTGADTRTSSIIAGLVAMFADVGVDLAGPWPVPKPCELCGSTGRAASSAVAAVVPVDPETREQLYALFDVIEADLAELSL